MDTLNINGLNSDDITMIYTYPSERAGLPSKDFRLQVALDAHAECCPFYSTRNGQSTCMMIDKTERPCDKGCEYCERFVKLLS